MRKPPSSSPEGEYPPPASSPGDRAGVGVSHMEDTGVIVPAGLLMHSPPARLQYNHWLGVALTMTEGWWVTRRACPQGVRKNQEFGISKS